MLRPVLEEEGDEEGGFPGLSNGWWIGSGALGATLDNAMVSVALILVFLNRYCTGKFRRVWEY